MPRSGAYSRPVQVRFDPDTVKRITALAEGEGWTWRPAADAAPIPSTSEAVRRLVVEALDARNRPAVNGHAVTIDPRGLDWIDQEAQREGVSRDDMARTLFREAYTARAAAAKR